MVTTIGGNPIKDLETAHACCIPKFIGLPATMRSDPSTLFLFVLLLLKPSANETSTATACSEASK